MYNIWVLDVGTSGTHGLLLDKSASILFSAYEEYHPYFGANGQVTQDPADWLRAISAVSKACGGFLRETGISLDAISLTCQRSSLLLLDRQLAPLGPAIMWQDMRPAALLEQMDPSAHEGIFQKTGAWPNPIFTGPKCLWYQQEAPLIWEQAEHICVIADYLLAQLTGQLVTDVTYAARTHLMDLSSEQWDPWLCEQFQVPVAKLSPIVKQGSIVGMLSASFATACGLPGGIPVVTAGGDQQCAALGAGILQPGHVLINMGTGANILAWSDVPVLDASHRFLSIPAAVPGGYLLESSTLTAASIYRWFHEQFYQEDTSYAHIDQEAQQAGIGSHGLLLLPYFQGRGTPDWNRSATGTFHGIHLGTSRGDFARAILEGISLEISQCLSMMGKFSQITLSGGLTSCPFLDQMVADITGVSVGKCQLSNQTAMGAWANAVKALEPGAGYPSILQRYSKGGNPVRVPNEQSHSIYAQISQQKEELYRHLYP